MCMFSGSSPKTDQHQISPNNISTSSRKKVMRTDEDDH